MPDNPFSQKGRTYPRERFIAAIDNLLPLEYKNINDNMDLFAGIRNGLLHSLLPNPNIWLRQSNNTEYEHLSIHKIGGTDRVVLIIEIMNADFQQACYKVLCMNTIKLEQDVLLTQE
jgi:hypothetical protein